MLLYFEASRSGVVSLFVLQLIGKLSLCAISLLFVPSPPSVQDVQEKTEEVIRISTDLVTIPAIVTDSKGHRVLGLHQQDFTVLSDKSPVQIQFFSAGADHVALAFLLDASGSARDYVGHEREAALSLLSRFGPGSQVAVLQFSGKVNVAVPFTNIVDQARSGFQFPAVSNQRTAIFDAALTAIKLFGERKAGATERRIIILTSDGLDTASTTSAAFVIQAARQVGISFYVIHFPIFSPRDGHLEPRSPTKGFRALAEKTGGQYFMVGNAKSALEPETANDLSPIFKAIAEDLEGQYLLGFYPDKRSGNETRHRVEVNLTHSTTRGRVKILREEYQLKSQ
jgi:Ca-activated chloride channel homolog